MGNYLKFLSWESTKEIGVLWADQACLWVGWIIEVQPLFSVFLMYVCINAWIWSSRATRTPYHARVLMRSSVLWGNHSMLFPHGGSKKRHSGRLFQTQPAVFGCLANPSTMNQTQTLVWVAVHFYHDSALVAPEYQSLSFSSIFEWISGCPRDPNLFISKYP